MSSKIMVDRRERIFESPVRWLLGKQLLGGLKGILLYSAYGAKLDPRDWMTAKEVIFEPPQSDKPQEFWFDYLSDAGDGTRAMYSIAYHTLATLWIRPQLPTSIPNNDSDCAVKTVSDGEFKVKLPRGEFLFFGGDTAYHAAEYLTLVNRIQRPFRYAYEDLRERELITDEDPRRPLFGIPGNHDYYDQIDGFRRQFRKPVRPEGPLPPKQSNRFNAALTLPGFQRVQEASYVALRLPFGWQMWGLDTESPTEREKLNLDLRQEKFFTSIPADAGQPDKLILATCSPSTVFGKIADKDDPKVARPMKALGVATPFLQDEGETFPETTGDGQLKEGQCRLDLSGDVHHYARYWGPKAPAGSAIRKHNTLKESAVASSYASIVSGAGGAFHHPSATYSNKIHEQVLYPSEVNSNAEVSSSLFKFWNVLTGGYVWLAGVILAFTIYFGVTVPRSSRQFIDRLGIINKLEMVDIHAGEGISPTIVQTSTEPCKNVQAFWPWTRLGVVTEEWQPANGCSAAAPVYIFADPRPWPWDLKLGQILIWFSVAAICTIFYISLFKKWFFDDDRSIFDKTYKPGRRLLPIVFGTWFLLIVGLFSVRPYYEYITPFVSSLLILFCLFSALTAIALNFRYSDYLFKKSFVPIPIEENTWRHRIVRKLNEYVPWCLWIFGLSVIGCGLWFFGRNNLPSYLISDIIFMVVLILGVIGIIALPFKVGADLLCTTPKPLAGLGKLFIGIWHLILQLLVPYILVRNGNFATWLIAGVLVVLPIPIAQYLLKKDSRLGLSILWLVYGGIMLVLPWLVKALGLLDAPTFANTEGWMRLLPTAFAGAVGSVICCLWTGWYFAVCFAFNGHNNEVGGTARIEKFKEFIRFRLTPEGLTGYVIAIDDPSKIGGQDSNGRYYDGSDLDVKLIDVFHLVPKSN